ncbi:glycosyltransferase [Variovorax dokdonensis]|uniref:Glycosyltransferase n=1 Tax=Variovorax dokdonensis TaxID=344883 RepID=A0ABT7NDY2_9BURK|nr:glycosyltransferase [Variovorax dokdonensis]MDM0046151.1 glycosyltransferase [Variovorax dokdonensis]
MSELTVAICAHNPRKEFIDETLAALRAQTVPVTEWSLLVIDNASTPALSDRLDLDWHPRARIVVEASLGISAARARALQEASAQGASLLLFVDDDNILAPDYLAQGLRIATEHPELGCWGGQLIARFLAPPPEWLPNYQKYLAIFPLAGDIVCTEVGSHDGIPPSAGAFVRRAVWEKYLAIYGTHPLRQILGPRGTVRIGGEDMDLMLTSLDVGLGFGRFAALKLEHIMPAGRLTAPYMEELLTSIYLGMVLVDQIRFERPPPRRLGALQKLAQRWRAFRLPEPIGRFYLAEIKGRELGARIVADWRQGRPISGVASGR